MPPPARQRKTACPFALVLGETAQSVKDPQGGASKEGGVVEESSAPQAEQGDFLDDLARRVLIVRRSLRLVAGQHVLEGGIHESMRWFFSAKRRSQRTDGRP